MTASPARADRMASDPVAAGEGLDVNGPVARVLVIGEIVLDHPGGRQGDRHTGESGR